MNHRFSALSLVLNVVLLVVFLYCLKTDRAPRRSRSEVKNELGPTPASLQKTNLIDVATTPVTKFHWREIESEDYPTYMANLRAVNCPEKTIFDIIFADIEKLFAERKKQVEKKQKFWLTGDDFEKAQLAKEENLFQLNEEKRALIQTLLQSELDWEVLQNWYDEGALGICLGFLPDAQIERVLSVAKKYVDRGELIEKRSGGLTTPEDAEEGLKIYAEMIAEIGRIISPIELEEGQLRMAMVFGYLFSSGKLKESNLSGAELRHLMKLQKLLNDPAQMQLAKFEGKETAPEIQAQQEFVRQVRKFLGENRFAQYLRAHDRGFDQLCQTAENNGLQLKIAISVYEIQQAVLLESARLREDRTLRRKEQRQELEAMEQSTRGTIQQLLGEKIAASYSTNGGKWLERIGQP